VVLSALATPVSIYLCGTATMIHTHIDTPTTWGRSTDLAGCQEHHLVCPVEKLQQGCSTRLHCMRCMLCSGESVIHVVNASEKSKIRRWGRAGHAYTLHLSAGVWIRGSFRCGEMRMPSIILGFLSGVESASSSSTAACPHVGDLRCQRKSARADRLT